MRPMCHGDFQRPDDGMPDTVPQADSEPSQRESNLVWHPNSPVGWRPDLAVDRWRSRRHCTIAADTIRFVSGPIGWCKRWPIVPVAVVVADAAVKVVAAVNIVAALSQAVERTYESLASIWHLDTVAEAWPGNYALPALLDYTERSGYRWCSVSIDDFAPGALRLGRRNSVSDCRQSSWCAPSEYLFAVELW